MSSGLLYARPMSAPPTDGPDSSSLLPTPAAGDANWGEKGNHGKDGGPPKNYGLVLTNAVQLLPTPKVSDANGSGSHGDGGPDLRTAVQSIGATTCPPSNDGNGPSDGPHPIPSTTEDDST